MLMHDNETIIKGDGTPQFYMETYKGVTIFDTSCQEDIDQCLDQCEGGSSQ